MYHIFKSKPKENCKNLFDNIFKRLFDDEHDTTTRKQRHTEGKNHQYVVEITLFRRHTDETSPRK